MKYGFPYACYNLGELSEGDTVVVRLAGAAANVLLLDRRNFERYRAGSASLSSAGIAAVPRFACRCHATATGSSHWTGRPTRAYQRRRECPARRRRRARGDAHGIGRVAGASSVT